MKRNSSILIIGLLGLSLVLPGCNKIWQSPLDQTERSNNPVLLPVISELFPSAITTNSAIILWKTPKPANSTVIYGVSSDSMTTVNDPSQVVEHSIHLSGLSSGTTYYFTVSNNDSMGNSYISSQMNFTTESLNTDSLGPIVSNLALSPTPTAGATLLSVTGTVSDINTGNSNVTAAECFIDTPGANGTGTALSAQDSVYDSSTENVNGTITISSLSAGTHKVYIHGKDANNNWGDFLSADLTVTAGSGTDTTGPLVSNFTINPNPTAGVTSATITATVSDTGTGGSTIAGAEYFVDAQGTNGAGLSLNAQDGAFSSATETVTGTLSTTGLSTGSHQIYLHGRDSKNNWGSFQTVALVISAAASTKPDATSTTTVTYTLSSPASHSTEAIWIEDSLGNFIRTLFIGSYVNEKPTYLPTWSSVSAGKTDGTTGASKATGSFNINWKPCYPTGSTTVVSPGSYRYRIEYREEGSTSTVWTGTITLGDTASSSSGSGTTGRKISALSGAYIP